MYMTYSLCGHGIPGPISFFVQCKLAAELVHVWVWPSSGWNINHRYRPMGVVTIMVHPNIKYIRCLCHTMLMKYASCTSTISKCHLYISWWPILTRVESKERWRPPGLGRISSVWSSWCSAASAGWCHSSPWPGKRCWIRGRDCGWDGSGEGG